MQQVINLLLNEKVQQEQDITALENTHSKDHKWIKDKRRFIQELIEAIEILTVK